MIKRNQEYLNRISTIIDFVLVVFSYIFSAWFRLKVLNGWWENQGLSIPMVHNAVHSGFLQFDQSEEAYLENRNTLYFYDHLYFYRHRFHLCI